MAVFRLPRQRSDKTMLLLYITTALLPVFILLVKAKKTKETKRQRTMWEDRLARLNPIVLRNIQVDKEVVSGKKYYPSDIKKCDVFVLPTSIVMLAKKESWRYPDITATSLAKQHDNLLSDAHETVITQSVSSKESDNGSKTLQIEGKDANVILRMYTISFNTLSADQLKTLQTALAE
jgi:hypothetical protein